MRRTDRIVRGAVAVVAVATLVAAGCGDDEGDGDEQAAGADAGGGSFAIEGRWRGDLEQRGLGRFTVTADIRSLDGGPENTVSYSKIDCSGSWSYLGREQGAFRFRERIDRGRGGTCKGVGIVTLDPARADRLRYEFRGGGVESSGTLVRSGG